MLEARAFGRKVATPATAKATVDSIFYSLVNRLNLSLDCLGHDFTVRLQKQEPL
jgi:hypothetical protein